MIVNIVKGNWAYLAIRPRSPMGSDTVKRMTGLIDVDVQAYGPQRAEETKVARRIRAHQSWYRLNILGAIEWGATPPPGSHSLGSILSKQSADRGANFISDEGRRVYEQRRKLGWGVEPYRCERYMTSSQALTINLFAPLMNDFKWLKDVISELGCKPLGRLRSAHLEYQPLIKSNGHTDKTIVDFCVIGEDSSLVVETKLIDQFSRRQVSARAKAFYANINTKNPLWLDIEPSFSAGPEDQLARIHALGASLSPGPVDLLFIHHPLDISSPVKVHQYSAMLIDSSQVKIANLDKFVDALEATATGCDQLEYARKLRLRYLAHDLSEGAFLAMEKYRLS